MPWKNYKYIIKEILKAEECFSQKGFKMTEQRMRTDFSKVHHLEISKN